MKQLTQNLKTGEMKVLDVAYPALSKGFILVRNHYSLISAGTEKSKVVTARKGYIGKALERPKEVRKVIDGIKKEGFTTTYNKVMKKLDVPTELGYSSSGVVIAVGDSVDTFKIGDRVACGGAGYANHAEIVAIPKHLAVKLPSKVLFEDAAYATLGSIALQGIRQADLRLGESCAVIGLGLLGQLTIQMLNASGVRAFGLDINDDAVKLAEKSGAVFAGFSSQKSIPIIEQLTGGFGVDAVIITAGTSSLEPIELAGQLCRKKGKVVIVGSVPTGFSRENYYQKELELRMSCSYGPGRYDANYEEKGIDYPIGYVRWTENRNLAAVVDMLSGGKLNLKILTTHTFDLDKASDAYKMVLTNSEPYVGILIRYDIKKEIKKIITNPKPQKVSKITLGFIGAGSYAQSYILPFMPKGVTYVGIATAQGNHAVKTQEKFQFKYATGDFNDVIEDKKINTVFIVTRHDIHGIAVIGALEHNKNVYVEKPLAMTEKELNTIADLVQKTGKEVMVGFNRRFSPFIQQIKEKFTQAPMSMIYRINAGKIPKEHWIQDKDVGGGRIIGEVCHFVDLLSFICSSPVKSVYASVMDDKNNTMDTLTISLEFQNGSIGTIAYYANGSSDLQKEYLEVYSFGQTAVLDDFKKLKMYLEGKVIAKSISSQDKGQKNEITKYIEALQEGKCIPIPFTESYNSSLATLKVLESIKKGQKLDLNP